MALVRTIFFIFLSFLCAGAVAQKVKYKDIFGLLETKQYDAAEPFLKKYLGEEDDNPNAFLNMGLIYEQKVAAYDELKETNALLTVIDSAIFFFDKASRTIDEREIKKNREYYQAYNRRDLRTGEFDVKLSDIQFDIQKKKEALVERVDRIKMVNYYFAFADSLYRGSQVLYAGLQSSGNTLNDFYLQADDTTLLKLEQLESRFDSAVRFVERYQSSLQTLGSSTYKPVVTLVEIKDLQADGSSPADLYNNDLRLWDYATFADNSSGTIQNSIVPMRKDLVGTDNLINALRDKIDADSLPVTSELPAIEARIENSEAKKYDSDPLPLRVMEAKVARLAYRSTRYAHREIRDTSDLRVRSSVVVKEMEVLNTLDSLVSMIDDRMVDADSANYHNFISESFGDGAGLKKYIAEMNEYVVQERALLDEQMRKNDDALKWLVAAQDTIPIFFEAQGTAYQPLAIEEEKFTLGVHRIDTTEVSGYFCFITPSRQVNNKISFAVDSEPFLAADAGSVKGLSTQSGNQIYYVLIYSAEQVNEKFPCTVAKIYRSDGLSWSVNRPFDFTPEELVYDAASGELLVRAAENVVVFDKNGKEKP